MIMKYTQELYGEDARATLKIGMDRVHRAVAATMGAKGRNAIMRSWGTLVEPTNDGVSVARNIVVKDEFEALGADLIKQVAEKQVASVGDGTTTAIVVTHALIEEGLQTIRKVHPMVLRKELEEARDQAVNFLESIARPIGEGEMINVARVSVEDEGLAQIIAGASDKAGEFGEIIVERQGGYTTEVDALEGYFWERGYLSPYMITNERGEAELDSCRVIVTDKGLNLNNDLVPLLNEMLKNGDKNFLLVADKVEGELLATLIANKMKGILSVICVGRPETVDELEDLACLTQGTAITKERGYKLIEAAHVGKAKRILVKKDKTVVIGYGGPELEARIEDVKSRLLETPDDVVLKRRLAKLTSGVVTIRVGAKTEAEANYLKDKVDDAVAACRAAREEGIVPGGGYALYTVASYLGNTTDGQKALKKALTAPYAQILENAGIRADGNAYNVLTGQKVDDLVEAGIIDPAKVERVALENAVSLAGIFLTTESAIADFEEAMPAQGS